MGFEIINKIKKERGLTNAQIAKMSGVTLSTLDKITAGINTNPKLDTLQAICKVLDCRLDDFDDSPRPKNKNDISADDIKLIRKYNDLDDHGKEMVNLVLNKESDRCESEYMELVARGGKYKVKKEDVVAWVKQLNLDDYEEDHELG